MILASQFNRQAPQFRVLSETQCQELYAAALECLRRVGVRMDNASARALLARHGATINGEIVHIPADLVKQALESTPHEFTVWGRDDKQSMRVALDRVHFQRR